MMSNITSWFLNIGDVFSRFWFESSMLLTRLTGIVCPGHSLLFPNLEVLPKVNLVTGGRLRDLSYRT